MGLFRIDSIKKAARREAWYPSDDTGSTAYNPFGRFNPRQKKLRDEENVGGSRGLEHVSTENDAGPSPIESARRDEHRLNGPRKAGTFPPGGDVGMPPSSEKSEDIPSSVDTSNDSSNRTLTNRTDREMPNSVDDSPIEPDGGARKRTHRSKLMPWKKVTDSGLN